MAGAPAPVKEPFGSSPYANGGTYNGQPFGLTNAPKPGSTYPNGLPTVIAPHNGNAAAGIPGWAPKPPPAGSYSPYRDVEIATGKEATEQTEKGLERQGADNTANYTANLSELERKGQETLARLAESYKKLGARQGEQANSDGTLYGGALLASAAKRAQNEGVAKSADEASQSAARGKLEAGFNQGQEAVREGIVNAGLTQQTAKEGVEKVRNTEATELGSYKPQSGAESLAQHAAHVSHMQQVNEQKRQAAARARNPLQVVRRTNQKVTR